MKHPLGYLADAVPGAVLASFFFQDSSWITVSVGGVVSLYLMNGQKIREKYLPHITDFGLLVGGAAYWLAQRRNLTPNNSLVVAGATTLVSSFFVSDDLTHPRKRPTLVPTLPTSESGGVMHDVRTDPGFSLIGNQPNTLTEHREKFLWSRVYDQGH